MPILFLFFSFPNHVTQPKYDGPWSDRERRATYESVSHRHHPSCVVMEEVAQTTRRRLRRQQHFHGAIWNRMKKKPQHCRGLGAVPWHMECSLQQHNNPKTKEENDSSSSFFESEEEESHTHDDDSDATHFPSVRAWMYNPTTTTTSRLVDIFSNFLFHLQRLFITLFFFVWCLFRVFHERNYFIFWFVIPKKKKKMPGNDPHRRFNRR